MERNMKKKDYIYIALYVLLFGWFMSTIVDSVKYEKEQFTKTNKLNIDLIKISNYVSSNSELLNSLQEGVSRNSREIEELLLKWKEQQNINDLLFFNDTNTEELVEETIEQTEEVQPTLPVVVPEEQEIIEGDLLEAVVSCPRPNKDLYPFIKNINIRRDYSFKVMYDVRDRTHITNIIFDKKLPTRITKAVTKFIMSLETNGDIAGCVIPITIKA
tara:strand:+ start:119 stop:766 length:648 start_codon:yes stop_codon:yes gene_type:complete